MYSHSYSYYSKLFIIYGNNSNFKLNIIYTFKDFVAQIRVLRRSSDML